MIIVYIIYGAPIAVLSLRSPNTLTRNLKGNRRVHIETFISRFTHSLHSSWLWTSTPLNTTRALLPMDKWGIRAAAPALPRGTLQPRFNAYFEPWAATLYVPKATPAPILRANDFYSSSNDDWTELETEIALPEEQSADVDPDLLQDQNPPTNDQWEVSKWENEQQEPWGEEPYATRDNRKTLTKLQWKVLKESMQRSKYTATSAKKLTRKGIEEAIATYATEEELKQIIAEQNGEIEAQFPSNSKSSSSSGRSHDKNLADVDAEADFLENQKKKVSPHRTELEKTMRMARDTKNNKALRPDRTFACYPCRREKRPCDNSRKHGIGLDVPCARCLGREASRGRDKYDASACCKLIFNDIPVTAQQAWLGEKLDEINWEVKKQMLREQVQRGERSHVGRQAAEAVKKKLEKKKSEGGEREPRMLERGLRGM